MASDVQLPHKVLTMRGIVRLHASFLELLGRCYRRNAPFIYTRYLQRKGIEEERDERWFLQ